MSQRVTVKSGGLWYGAKRLGPRDHIYVYPGEEKHLGVEDSEEHVTVCTTPGNIDFLFALPNGKIVGGEVKRPDDLVKSHRSRRLARQVRTLRDTVDISVLVLRGGLDVLSLYAMVSVWHPRPWEFWEDLTGLQTQGVYLLPVPLTEYWPWLKMFRKAVSASGARCLAGNDRRESRERQPGWLLRRIPGIGPDRSKRLVAEYGSSLGALIAAKGHRVGPKFGKFVEEKLCQAGTE